jgi:hypothetical protein
MIHTGSAALQNGLSWAHSRTGASLALVLSRPVSRPGSDVDLNSEARLLARLRGRDEEAFMELVARLGPSMLRVAELYVRDRSVAEEIVQDAWLRALRGLDGFEERSSLSHARS